MRTAVATADRPTLVLATGNPGKVTELADLLGAYFDVRPRPADLPDTVEDQNSLTGNSMKKACEVSDHTGMTALADDTGLFVAALDERPGVLSARYAGPNGDSEANRAKMLTELRGVTNRRAWFETIIVVRFGREIPDLPAMPEPLRRGVPVIGWGRITGTITTEPRGDGGFGYDSIFEPDEGDGRTFAEMARADKQAISHRGQALADVLGLLGLNI